VVADLSDIWLDITIYDKDLAQVKIGQNATFVSDSLGGRKFDGKISYIQPLAGDSSRTFLARAVLPNRQMALKPGMFGTAIIHTHRKEYLPYVADSSVQRYGKEIFVFEDMGGGKFAKRPIELGERLLDGYLIKSGLRSGAPLVNSGSLTLKAEFLKRLNGAQKD
jgi:multidrug efflux pump subunit AcrA (membrane-fusion protein)